MKKAIIKTICILLFSFAVCCPCAALSDRARSACSPSRVRTVSVSGTGSVSMKADIVSFNVGISEKADTTGQAQQLANAKTAQVLAIIRNHNVKDEDISTTSLSFNTEYKWSDGEQIRLGEIVSQNICVTMHDISSFGTLVDELGSSVSGISFNNVNFASSEKEAAQIKARELAYKNAYEKACTYAKESNLYVVAPITIEEGSTSFGNRNSSDLFMAKAMATAESASYSTDAPSGTLCSTVNVNIKFELKEKKDLNSDN